MFFDVEYKYKGICVDCGRISTFQIGKKGNIKEIEKIYKRGFIMKREKVRKGSAI